MKKDIFINQTHKETRIAIHEDDVLVELYVEKPEKNYMVSMGIYVYEPSVLRYIEPDRHLDFPDLVLKLIKNDEKVIGYPFDGHWLDIGTQEDYIRAQQEFKKMEQLFLPVGVC